MQPLIATAAIIDNTHILKPAVIQIDKGIIVNITDRIPNKAANITRLEDTILLPGFVNAHAHLELTDIGPLTAHEFVPWIMELNQHKRRQTDRDIAQSVQNGFLAMQESGVTTVVDHISFNTNLAVFNQSPLNVYGFGEVVGSKKAVSEELYKAQTLQKQKAKFPFQLSPHAVHTVDESMLAHIFANHEPPYSIHLAEYQAEQDYFATHQGAFVDFISALYPELKNTIRHNATSAIKYLDQNGLHLKDSLIIHGNYLNEEDINIMSRCKGNTVVHCPGSFDFFNHKVFPYHELCQHKIPVALGTDSIASNTCLNFLHEIKLFLKEFPHTTLFELLPLITTNACQTLKLDKCGQISTGYKAHIVGFDNFRPSDDILNLFSSRSHVDHWMMA